MLKMAPKKRVVRTVKETNNNCYKNLTLNKALCPICRNIFVEPVTLPCNHGFCLSCFEGTVANANLTCPLCRVRFGSWHRIAKKENKIVNTALWNAVRENFPDQVKNRLDGVEENLDEDSNVIMRVASPGAIRREYELQRKRDEQERRKEDEAEAKASELLIQKLREEEEYEEAVREEKLRLDEKVAKQLAAELGAASPVKNTFKSEVFKSEAFKSAVLKSELLKSGAQKPGAPKMEVHRTIKPEGPRTFSKACPKSKKNTLDQFLLNKQNSVQVRIEPCNAKGKVLNQDNGSLQSKESLQDKTMSQYFTKIEKSTVNNVQNKESNVSANAVSENEIDSECKHFKPIDSVKTSCKVVPATKVPSLVKKLVCVMLRPPKGKKEFQHDVTASAFAYFKPAPKFDLIDISYQKSVNKRAVDQRKSENLKRNLSQIENDSTSYLESRLKESKFADSNISGSLLIKNKFRENKSTKNKVTENKITENKHIENKLVEDKIVENKYPENKYLENKLTENKFTENKLTENKFAENNPIVNKCTLNKLTENKLPENKFPENRFKECKLTDSKLVEKNNYVPSPTLPAKRQCLHNETQSTNSSINKNLESYPSTSKFVEEAGCSGLSRDSDSVSPPFHGFSSKSSPSSGFSNRSSPSYSSPYRSFVSKNCFNKAFHKSSASFPSKSSSKSSCSQSSSSKSSPCKNSPSKCSTAKCFSNKSYPNKNYPNKSSPNKSSNKSSIKSSTNKSCNKNSPSKLSPNKSLKSFSYKNSPVKNSNKISSKGFPQKQSPNKGFSKKSFTTKNHMNSYLEEVALAKAMQEKEDREFALRLHEELNSNGRSYSIKQTDVHKRKRQTTLEELVDSINIAK